LAQACSLRPNPLTPRDGQPHLAPFVRASIAWVRSKFRSAGQKPKTHELLGRSGADQLSARVGRFSNDESVRWVLTEPTNVEPGPRFRRARPARLPIDRMRIRVSEGEVIPRLDFGCLSGRLDRTQIGPACQYINALYGWPRQAGQWVPVTETVADSIYIST